MPSSAIFGASIWFIGLILHVETDSATHTKVAYLVDARNVTGVPKHQPKLELADSDFTVTGTSEWPKMTSNCKAGFTCYMLDGVELKVESTPSIGDNVTIDGSFDDHVLHLQTGLSGPDDLWSDLKNKKLHTGAVASVEYASGTLSAPICYRFDAVLVNGTPTCLARWVSVELPANYTWKISDKNDATKEITLKPQGRARIWNHTTHASNHRDLYKFLLQNGTAPKKLAHTAQTCASTCIPDATHGPTVECSNSQWP